MNAGISQSPSLMQPSDRPHAASGVSPEPLATPAPQQLSLRRPDDWHVHLRDGPLLQAVAPATARQFARAIVMPNLSPPITTVAAARAYRRGSAPPCPRAPASPR